MSKRIKGAEENNISLERRSAYALKTMTELTAVSQQLRRIEVNQRIAALQSQHTIRLGLE
jgi:hypothetical protein